MSSHISEFIQFISGRDFAINVTAGLLIFVLDAILIAVILPRIIQRRIEKSWLPSRQAFVRICIERYELICGAANNCVVSMRLAPEPKYSAAASANHNTSEGVIQRWAELESSEIFSHYVHFASRTRAIRGELIDEVSNFSACFDAKLLNLASSYLASMKVLIDISVGDKTIGGFTSPPPNNEEAIDIYATRVFEALIEMYSRVERGGRKDLLAANIRVKTGKELSETICEVRALLKKAYYSGLAEGTMERHDAIRKMLIKGEVERQNEEREKRSSR